MPDAKAVVGTRFLYQAESRGFHSALLHCGDRRVYLVVRDLCNHTYSATTWDEVTDPSCTLVVRKHLDNNMAMVGADLSRPWTDCAMINSHCPKSPSLGPVYVNAHSPDSDLKILSVSVQLQNTPPTAAAVSGWRQCPRGRNPLGHWVPQDSCLSRQCVLHPELRTTTNGWVQADRYMWETLGCRLRYYSRLEAVSRFKALGYDNAVFIGDSRTRNLFSAVQEFFLGHSPMANAQIKYEFSTDGLKFTYVEAYTLNAERKDIGLNARGAECWDIRQWGDRKQYSLSPGANSFRRHGGPTAPLVVAQLGIHYLNSYWGEPYYRQEVKSLFELLNPEPGSRRRVVVQSVPPVADGRSKQNMARVDQLNRIMKAEMPDGVEFFDANDMAQTRFDRWYHPSHFFPASIPTYTARWNDFPRLVADNMLLLLLNFLLNEDPR